MKVAIAFVVCACIFVQLVLGGGVTLGVNEIPQWDLCVNGGDLYSCSGHGSCSGGQCVCTNGYSGRDCSIPPQGFDYTIPKATVTQFCQLETGGCAPGMCVGGGLLDHTSLPPGIDGVAAVNPTLYGSRYAYTKTNGAGSDRTLNGLYSFVGQSCGTCWKLTRKRVSIVVTVVDRCAGYCRATVGANQQCSTSELQGGKECGECIQLGQASTPQCSCLSRNSTANGGWCNGFQAAHCDWCAANDHPHFDLDITAQAMICDDAVGDGFCHLDSFQMVACPDLVGPWPNGYPNGTGVPDKPNNGGGGPTVDLTADKCYFTAGDGQCKSIHQGEYTCNGCNLTMCNLGLLRNLGCPAGTSCSNGACEEHVPCDPSVTACSGDSAPATQAPSTQAPATQAPATHAPATQAPATQAPATQAPATQAPGGASTQAPTVKPTERPPVSPTTKPTNPTNVPSTQAPATQAPGTQAPGTQAPGTQAPGTQAPGTQAPATQAPATQAPATQAPGTQAPATQAPGTQAPGEEPTQPPEHSSDEDVVGSSTQPPATQAPGEEEPSEEPTQDEPTQPPATQPDVTEAPTEATQSPATQAPATQGPATQAPTASASTKRPTSVPTDTPAKVPTDPTKAPTSESESSYDDDALMGATGSFLAPTMTVVVTLVLAVVLYL